MAHSDIFKAFRQVDIEISEEVVHALAEKFPRSPERALDYYLGHQELFKPSVKRGQLKFPDLDESTTEQTERIPRTGGESGAEVVPVLSSPPQSSKASELYDKLLSLGYPSGDAYHAARRTSSVEAAVGLIQERASSLDSPQSSLEKNVGASSQVAIFVVNCPRCRGQFNSSDVVQFGNSCALSCPHCSCSCCSGCLQQMRDCVCYLSATSTNTRPSFTPRTPLASTWGRKMVGAQNDSPSHHKGAQLQFPSTPFYQERNRPLKVSGYSSQERMEQDREQVGTPLPLYSPAKNGMSCQTSPRKTPARFGPDDQPDVLYHHCPNCGHASPVKALQKPSTILDAETRKQSTSY